MRTHAGPSARSGFVRRRSYPRSLSPETASVVQAIAAAVSALTAFGLAALTVWQARDRSSERDRALEREQLRAIVDALEQLQQMVDDDTRGLLGGFELARAELAAALSLRPIDLPHCRALLSGEMPLPPYAFGHTPYEHLHRAHEEVRRFAEAREAARASR